MFSGHTRNWRGSGRLTTVLSKHLEGSMIMLVAATIPPPPQACLRWSLIKSEFRNPFHTKNTCCEALYVKESRENSHVNLHAFESRSGRTYAHYRALERGCVALSPPILTQNNRLIKKAPASEGFIRTLTHPRGSFASNHHTLQVCPLTEPVAVARTHILSDNSCLTTLVSNNLFNLSTNSIITILLAYDNQG